MMGTLEEDFPIDNERYEHSEMLLYKVNMRNHSNTPTIYVFSCN
jgi:hypothetical protein